VSTASQRIKRTQRGALLFLVASNALNYVDRSTIAIANPLIRHDLGMSLGQMGLVLSAFLWTYSVMQLPIGALVDRFKPRLMLTVGLLVWSVAQALGGTAAGLSQMVATRVALGVGESAQFPASLRVLREWWNKRDRGFATGLFSTGSSIGTAISAPLLTWLMLALNWRWMFALMGLGGVALAVGWHLSYQNARDAALTADERAHLTEGEEAGPASGTVGFLDWARLLQFRSTWGILLGVGCYTYLLTFYYSWLPTYLEMDRHMSISKTGLAAAVPFLFGIFGSLCGGALVDFLARRGFSATDSSRLPCICGVVAAVVFTIGAAEAGSNVIAIGCMSGAVFFLYLNMASAWTLAAAVAPESHVASMAGFKGFGGYVGAALAPIVTGFLAQETHSFEAALLISAAAGLLAACCFWLGVRGPISQEALFSGSDRRHAEDVATIST
jgi:sugar phosphate permease